MRSPATPNIGAISVPTYPSEANSVSSSTDPVSTSTYQPRISVSISNAHEVETFARVVNLAREGALANIDSGGPACGYGKIAPWRPFGDSVGLCRYEDSAAFEVEGHAGEQISREVARGIEVAHAREAVGALEGTEHSFHRTAQWYDRVIARDLVGCEWFGPLAASHDPVSESPCL